MPSFCAICALWRHFLQPDAQTSTDTVSARPAGCKASQRLLCTDPRYMHDIGVPSIYRTEDAERTEQNTLLKTCRNSQTLLKRLKTHNNAISRRFPDEKHAAGAGKLHCLDPIPPRT
jgi:hypothetical protein